LIELPKPALPGEARNAGLRVAQGDIVSFPGSHVELPPGSLEARIRAHDLGYAMVTGSTLNGTTTDAGWASYFLDHSAVLPGRPSTELKGAPSHCSYTREALIAAGGFPEDMRAGEDTVVNQRIAARGLVAYRAQDVTLIHHSPCRTPVKLVKHHFKRGRGFGRILLDQRRERGNLLTRKTFESLFTKQLRKRLEMTRRHVDSWGSDEERAHFERVQWLVGAGATAAWLGTWYEILKPELGLRKPLLLKGKPVYTVLLAGLDRWSGEKIGGRADVMMLVRFDLISRRIRIVSLPRDLQAEIPGHGVTRINSAFHLGAVRNADDPEAGPRLLVEMLSKRFDLRIDDYFVLDFDGFMELIDAMGGVEIDVPEAIEDSSEWKEDDGTSIGTLKFEAGPQLMDGDRALKYARLRQRDSDTARRARHLRVLMAMADRVREIRSPAEALHLFRTARRVVQTSVTPARAALLLYAAAVTPREQIASARLAPPLLQQGKTKSGLFVWKGDDAKIRAFVREKLETRTEDELATALERSPAQQA
jgi:LCP family protein required for cell wall assembly